MNSERKKELKPFFDKLAGVLDVYYDTHCVYTKEIESHIRQVAQNVWEKCLLDGEVSGEMPDICFSFNINGNLEISFLGNRECTCRFASMIPREYDPDTNTYTCTRCGGVVRRDWYKGMFLTSSELSEEELIEIFKNIGDHKNN